MKNLKKDGEEVEKLTVLEKQYLEVFPTTNVSIPGPPLSLVQPPAYTYIPSVLTFGTEEKPITNTIH